MGREIRTLPTQKFASYRSLALKHLNKICPEFELRMRYRTFSTWTIDNIAADYWTKLQPVDLCAIAMDEYVMGLEK